MSTHAFIETGWTKTGPAHIKKIFSRKRTKTSLRKDTVKLFCSYILKPGVGGPFSEEQLDEGLAKRCREVSVEDRVDTGIRVRKHMRTNLRLYYQ